MKNFLLCALLASSFFNAKAQSDKNIEKGLFKINALTPGVSYEIGVGNDISVNLDALIVIAGGSRGPNDFNIGFFPGIDAELRYFTNMERRLSKGKNINGNSGNYVALHTGFQYGEPIIGTYELDNTSSISLGAVYGLQRTYRKGFYWNLSFGPGLFFERDEIFGPFGSGVVNSTSFGLVGVGKIGWVIGKRRSR